MLRDERSGFAMDCLQMTWTLGDPSNCAWLALHFVSAHQLLDDYTNGTQSKSY